LLQLRIKGKGTGIMHSVFRKGIYFWGVFLFTIVLNLIAYSSTITCTLVSPAKKINNKTYTILKGKVYVTARSNSNQNEFDISVRKDSSVFHVFCRPFPGSDLSDSKSIGGYIEYIKTKTGWKGKYLFVRSDCGGGNASNCSVEVVFTINAGKLIRLGDLSIDDDSKIGSGYNHGYFTYFYDKIEANSLTSHADAPRFDIFMKDNNGKFVVDAEKTWKEGQIIFVRHSKYIRLHLEGHDGKIDDGLAAMILYNAAFSKYCNKVSELRKYITLAKKYFRYNEFRKFSEALAEVQPKEVIK